MTAEKTLELLRTRLLDIFTASPDTRMALAYRLENPASLDWSAFPQSFGLEHIIQNTQRERAVAIQQEREACAKVAEDYATDPQGAWGATEEEATAREIAQRIRARGEIK